MATDPFQVTDRRSLAAFVDEHSDDAIEEMARGVDPDAVLARVFNKMATDFKAETGPNRPVVLQWEIVGPDQQTRVWQLEVSAEGCAMTPGDPKRASLRLQLGFASFLRLVAGRLNGFKAVSSGKLKLRGNLLHARSLETWFIR